MTTASSAACVSAFVFLPLGAPLVAARFDCSSTAFTAFAAAFVVFTGALFTTFAVDVVLGDACLAFAARRAGAFRIFFRGDGGLSVAFARARVWTGIVGLAKVGLQRRRACVENSRSVELQSA